MCVKISTCKQFFACNCTGNIILLLNLTLYHKEQFGKEFKAIWLLP